MLYQDKYRRTRTLNNDESVIPRYRKGYEFWGYDTGDGSVVEEGCYPHSMYDVVKIG